MEEKVGEVNFKEFRTEIFVTENVKFYLETEKISLSKLIPDAYKFYEVLLFESIEMEAEEVFGEDEYESPRKEFGKNFAIVYNKITESLGFNPEKGLEVSEVEDETSFKEKALFFSGTKLSGNRGKDFVANYFVVLRN